MKRIAVIFITQRWDDSYSLTSVVRSQIRSLVANGYKFKVLTTDGCPPWKHLSKVQYADCFPKFRFDFNKTVINDEFYKEIDRAVEKVAPYLEDVDIVLAHDVLLIEPFLPHNLMVRKIAEKYPHIKWYHWCHSGASVPRPFKYPRSLLTTSMPNSKIVSVSRAHRAGFAKMYSVPLKDVLVIPNPRVTQDFLNFHPLTWEVIKKGELLSADIINVMATTISREHKQPEICLFVMAALKKEGASVRQVFINSFAEKNFGEEANILFLKWLAKDLGLSEHEVVFTSHVNKRLAKGCPSIMARDLLILSNIFIHPSTHESCSLVLLEAAITKHLCVLNSNVKAFREMVGEHAIWVNFDNLSSVMFKKLQSTGDVGGLDRVLKYYKEHEKFYRSLARQIIVALQRDPAQGAFSWVKSHYNEEAIFDRHIKKLLV